MFPYFVLFGRIITTYQVMVFAGVICSGFYACAQTRKNHLDYADTIILLLIGGTGAIIGSHILYALVNIHSLRQGQNIHEILNHLFSGSVFYGGLLGGIALASIFKRHIPDSNRLIDIITPAIPLFHAFGRIGCFLTGCCYGIPSRIGIILRKSTLVDNLPRLPVQLLEASFNFILFIVLHYLSRHNYFKNRLLYLYLILYSLARFIFEFLRGDVLRGLWFGASTSQIISVCVFAVALWRCRCLQNQYFGTPKFL